MAERLLSSVRSDLYLSGAGVGDGGINSEVIVFRETCYTVLPFHRRFSRIAEHYICIMMCDPHFVPFTLRRGGVFKASLFGVGGPSSSTSRSDSKLRRMCPPLLMKCKKEGFIFSSSFLLSLTSCNFFFLVLNYSQEPQTERARLAVLSRV